MIWHYPTVRLKSFNDCLGWDSIADRALEHSEKKKPATRSSFLKKHRAAGFWGLGNIFKARGGEFYMGPNCTQIGFVLRAFFSIIRFRWRTSNIHRNRDFVGLCSTSSISMVVNELSHWYLWWLYFATSFTKIFERLQHWLFLPWSVVTERGILVKLVSEF